jgi:hypothetical protein
MMKKITKIGLGLAAIAVIGLNGYFVHNVLAANNAQKAPVISKDVVPVKTEVSPESDTGSEDVVTVVVDDYGKQTIVWDESLSLEDQARLKMDLEEEMKANGIGISTFVAGTPSENDLAEEQAVEIAKSAVSTIIEQYALTDDTLARFSIGTVLNVFDPESPVWSVTFYPTNQNDFSEIGTYNITIDALSGEILTIMTAADGVG